MSLNPPLPYWICLNRRRGWVYSWGYLSNKAAHPGYCYRSLVGCEGWSRVRSDFGQSSAKSLQKNSSTDTVPSAVGCPNQSADVVSQGKSTHQSAQSPPAASPALGSCSQTGGKGRWQKVKDPSAELTRNHSYWRERTHNCVILEDRLTESKVSGKWQKNLNET